MCRIKLEAPASCVRGEELTNPKRQPKGKRVMDKHRLCGLLRCVPAAAGWTSCCGTRVTFGAVSVCAKLLVRCAEHRSWMRAAGQISSFSWF